MFNSVISSGIVTTILDLFFQYKWNNFLHQSVFGILSVPVYTGAGHVIKFDKQWLADDPNGVKRKLQSQIDYIFSATQIAGALHSGEYKSGTSFLMYSLNLV